MGGRFFEEKKVDVTDSPTEVGGGESGYRESHKKKTGRGVQRNDPEQEGPGENFSGGGLKGRPLLKT